MRTRALIPCCLHPANSSHSKNECQAKNKLKGLLKINNLKVNQGFDYITLITAQIQGDGHPADPFRHTKGLQGPYEADYC